MIKHTQTIRGQIADNCLSVFDHFVGFALKGLRTILEVAGLKAICLFPHSKSNSFSDKVKRYFIIMVALNALNISQVAKKRLSAHF